RYNSLMFPKTLAAALISIVAASGASADEVTLEPVEADVPARTVEIHGVGAGAFNPQHWQDGTLHLLPDARRPLLAPREGQWRNIYAPSAVEVDDGWRLFYGGWD